MQENNQHVSNIRGHTMYAAVKSETLARWLAHAEQAGLAEIAREIETEIKAREANEKPASD
jgi:hypothetical protein